MIHSFLFQFFTDTRVGISPAGSAVIGPQIAQYILLRPATKMKSSLLTSPFTLHQSEIDFPTDDRLQNYISLPARFPKVIK